MTKRKNIPRILKLRLRIDGIREEMTLSELSNKYGVHPTQIGAWKRAVIENMAAAFFQAWQ